MEEINRNNYEAYFIDYLDGNLNSGQKDDLMTFLKDNPDLKKELDELKNMPSVEGDEVSFRNKHELKKQLALSDAGYTFFDEFSLDKLEGNLSAAQEQEFNQLIREFPEKKKEYELYEKTVLKPDKKIRYRGKAHLKRGKIIHIYKHAIYQYATLAASVLLLVGLFFFLPEGRNIPYNDELDNVSRIPEYESNNQSTMSGTAFSKNDESVSLNHSSIAYNEVSSQPKPEINTPVSRSSNKELREEAPEPIQTKYSIRLSEKPVYADIIEPTEINEDFQIGNRKFDGYDMVNRFLARTLENPLKNNLADGNFSLWKIADFGFEGISKLTGKEILLERHYDGEGNLERLAFQTESFRVSTGLKK